jgi:putative flippase GtrA
MLAGGVAAAANYGSRFVFSIWVPYAEAVVLAYAVGMVVAFVLMRGFVFGARQGALVPQIAKFAAVNALAVLQTLVISVVLARWLESSLGAERAEACAHLVGVLFPIGTSYLGHKMATFR